MGIMSQLHADTIDRDEQIHILRMALEMARARFQALANNEPEQSAFRNIYVRWANEAREAAENT